MLNKKYPRRGELNIASAFTLLTVVFIVSAAAVTILTPISPPPLPDPAVAENEEPGDCLTPVEKKHLGLLNRVAAQELLTLSTLPEEEQEANKDYILRLTAAYSWSDDAAGSDAIFGAPKPPTLEDDEPAPARVRILNQELSPAPMPPRERSIRVPAPDGSQNQPSTSGSFLRDLEADRVPNDEYPPSLSWTCPKCSLKNPLATRLLPDEVRTCQCLKCTDWSWVEIGPTGTIDAAMIGG